MDIDVVKFLTEHSVLMALAGLVIWEKYQYSKTTSPLLAELSNSIKLQSASLDNLNTSLNTVRQSCDNTTMALNIISNTLPTIYNTLERHDKRSEYMNNDLREIAFLVKRRPGMAQKENTHEANHEN